MGMLIWPAEEASIRAFSSSSKGGATTIRIELAVSDPVAAGFILGDLAKEQRAEKEARKPVKPTKSPKPSLRALPAPMLALPAPEGTPHA